VQTLVGAACSSVSRLKWQPPPTLLRQKKVQRGIWVKPSLLVEIEYRAKSARPNRCLGGAA
jgi:hypothetical protein